MTAATECGYEIFPQPPYSPDLTSIKSHLHGTQYGIIESVFDRYLKYLDKCKLVLYYDMFVRVLIKLNVVFLKVQVRRYKQQCTL